MKNWFKDFVHNTLVHPLLPFLPRKVGDYLHRVTADWAWPDARGTEH